jgi:hypothetical protein
MGLYTEGLIFGGGGLYSEVYGYFVILFQLTLVVLTSKRDNLHALTAQTSEDNSPTFIMYFILYAYISFRSRYSLQVQ